MDIANHEKDWLTSGGSKMLKRLGIAPGDATVDFGCGIGRYTIPLSQAVGPTGHVTAIEYNPEKIQMLKVRVASFPTQGEIELITSADGLFASIPDHTIDAVLAFDVLQHVEDWLSFFQAARQRLKPSGALHIYPAKIPHPDAVDCLLLVETAGKAAFHLDTKTTFTMMHNRHIVTDVVYTFRP